MLRAIEYVDVAMGGLTKGARIQLNQQRRSRSAMPIPPFSCNCTPRYYTL